MERITESEEKNRDRDLDDLDFGDLDPADLGFTDPCFGDPGETPAAGGEKKEPESGTDSGNEAAGPAAEAGAEEAVRPGEESRNAKTEEAVKDPEKPEVAEKPEESAKKPEDTAKVSEKPVDTAKVSEKPAEAAKVSEEPAKAAETPEKPAEAAAAGKAEEADDPDADMKIRQSRRKRPVSYDESEDDEDYEDDEYDEEDIDEEELEEERRSTKIWLRFLLVSLLAAGLVGGLFYGCTVRNVYVKGSTLYTSQEIAERVISDDSQLRHNTVFLTILYHTPLAPKIPFVARVDVKPESFDTITITVKDKKMAGYIPYGGRNIYFSADGITLENSPLTVKGVTYVTGVTLNEAEVGLPLSSEDPQGLSLVLDALKILRKYEIKPESVVLTQSGSVTMFIGDVKVFLGRSDYELKIAKIAQILPYLEGRKGTIDLTNYTSSDQNIILK